MSAKQPHTIPVNQRVRLKLDGQDALYQAAYAGAPGWIRAQDHDRLGYPQVFIEWDKNHWSYQGEADKWAMEAHFEPVEEEDDMSQEPQSNDSEDPAALFAAFQEFMKQQKGQSVPAPEEDPEEVQFRERRAQANRDAQSVIEEADSFIVMAATKRDGPGGSPVYMPVALNFYNSNEGGRIAELQLSKLAAQVHEEVVLEQLQMTHGGGE